MADDKVHVQVRARGSLDDNAWRRVRGTWDTEAEAQESLDRYHMFLGSMNEYRIEPTQ